MYLNFTENVLNATLPCRVDCAWCASAFSSTSVAVTRPSLLVLYGDLDRLMSLINLSLLILCLRPAFYTVMCHVELSCGSLDSTVLSEAVNVCGSRS